MPSGQDVVPHLLEFEYFPALALLHTLDVTLDHFPEAHELQPEEPEDDHSPHAQLGQSLTESWWIGLVPASLMYLPLGQFKQLA